MIVLLYLALIALLFFVLIVLPQRRQLAAHRAMVASLAVGDEVITTGGIHGTIRHLDEAVIGLEVTDQVVLRVARNAVAQRVGPPAADDAEPNEAIDEPASRDGAADEPAGGSTS